MAEPIQACLELTDGSKIDLELYPDVAPLSVKNFTELCAAKFFDGLCFHRVIPGFMIQGGGFVYNKGLVPKESQKTVKGEFRSNGVTNNLHHAPGVLSMARTNVKDSATSQFFICVADSGFLDGEYAAFGKVVGEDALKKVIALSQVKTTSWSYYDDVPVEPIVIKTVTVAQKA